MNQSPNRRRFLGTGAGFSAATQLGFLSSLPAVSAREARLQQNELVRFDRELEPLVEEIESTPRAELVSSMAQHVHEGASYRQILAALLLAGIRNVQPQPAVGFKFHCVLVVNSCHLASLNGPDQDRWLPIFWALDYFKSSQADEARRSGWRMPPIEEALLPSATRCRKEFLKAMDAWDVERAEAAAVAITRHLGAVEVFELFARYAARDYRSIGHKAIYLANAWRTLQVIGWQYAEPVLRSLTVALLNHHGEPNPAESDLAPDRPWRENQSHLQQIPTDWLAGKLDTQHTQDLISTLRAATPHGASQAAAQALASGVGPQTIWDGIYTRSGELLMQQPGIIGLHALTTANALGYLYRNVKHTRMRQLLLLQACAFLPMFRDDALDRGKLGSQTIQGLASQPASDSNQAPLDEILADISTDRQAAAQKLLRFLNQGGNGVEFIDEARRLLFTKGKDAHDYKFASAVLEDYAHVSSEWRDRYLATTVFNLKGSGDADNQLAERTRAALNA